jgi:hypothetical protein
VFASVQTGRQHCRYRTWEALSHQDRAKQSEGIGAMYDAFKRLGNGEFIHVQSCETLEQAELLVEGLNDTWPGEYVVRDAEGNELGRTEKLVLNRT